MPDKKDQLIALRNGKKKIEEAVAKVQATLEALKGRTDEASTRKRAALNGTLEKLRAQKEAISQKIGSLSAKDGGEQQGSGADEQPDEKKNTQELEGLRDRLKKITAQQKARESVIADQVVSIREKIKMSVGENDMLKALLAKERLSMRMKFNARVIKMIDNPEQKREISEDLRDEAKRFAEWDRGFSDLMKEVDDRHKDDKEVSQAKEEAAAKMKEAEKREAEIAKLEDELKTHPDRGEDLKKKIADLKADPEGEKPEPEKKDEDPDEPKEVKSLRKEIEEFEKDLEVAQKNSNAHGDEGRRNRDAADILKGQIERKKKELERLRSK